MIDFKEIESDILNVCPNGYKLRGYVHDHNLTLTQFIHLFNKDLRYRFVTVTNNPNVNYTVPCSLSIEFFDNDYAEHVFLVCRYYYPDCTFGDVCNILEQVKQ